MLKLVIMFWSIFRFVKGFITRNEDVNEHNARFQLLVKSEWLVRLSSALPRSVLDTKWPEAPVSCKPTSEVLKVLYQDDLNYVAKTYPRCQNS